MSLTLTLERGGGEVTGSGTNIELDGTIAGGAIESVEMYGDTEQTTYSGKNLYEGSPSFDSFSNISAWEDGGTYNGMPVIKRAAAWTGAYRLINIEAGVTYTFSAWVKSDEARPVAIYAIGSGATATITPNNKNITTSTSWERVSFTFACSTSGTIALRFENTSASTTNYMYISGYQLEKNSSMTSYEPYVGGTASPNPDYPQEVNVVTGEQTITISDGGSQSVTKTVNLGKNLFDKDNANTLTGCYVDNDLRIVDTGNSTVSICYIKCEPNTTYTVQKENTGTNNRFALFTTATTPAAGVIALNLVGTNGAEDNHANYSITTPANAKYLGVFFAQPTGLSTPTSPEIMATIQIERGSTATTYAPYFTPIELCKIGDYQDYIYKSGEDWYVHKDLSKIVIDGSQSVTSYGTAVTGKYRYSVSATGAANVAADVVVNVSDKFVGVTRGDTYNNVNGIYQATGLVGFYWDAISTYTTEQVQTWLSTNNVTAYYPLATPTDTQITNSALIAQLDALNSAQTYDGTTVITVSSENLAGSLEVTVSTNIAKTYTEVEIGSPFTITDVEGKSSNTTLDGNVYVDWAYNKKQYSFDLFNLTPQDYSDIRAFYDYQFNNSAFPTITVPELNIDKLPVYMEISSRNIINQCLLTDKLTIKFRETVQP